MVALSLLDGEQFTAAMREIASVFFSTGGYRQSLCGFERSFFARTVMAFLICLLVLGIIYVSTGVLTAESISMEFYVFSEMKM